MKLLATPRFLKGIPAERKAEVFETMKAAARVFGQPHLHAGMGLRRIPRFIECRCGLDLRLVFQRDGEDLVFHLCGTHGEIRAFLKNRLK